MDISSKFLTPEIGFALTLVFGFWMSRAGRPYNGTLFNIHKLIALGTVIITAMQILGLLGIVEAQSFIILLIVATAISVVALFASGALLGIGNMNYTILKTIHNIAPFLAVLAMGLMIYLLEGNLL